jgi:dihydroflavonol-4-reductase
MIEKALLVGTRFLSKLAGSSRIGSLWLRKCLLSSPLTNLPSPSTIATEGSKEVIVVTGATGHVGNVLVRELLARGHVVRALVLPNDDRRPLAGLNVEIVHGDVTDPTSLKTAFAGADLIYHLAGIVTIMPGMAGILERVNVGGVRNVAAACRATGVRRLVYTSSIHAIAEPPHGTVIDESQPFDPDRVLGDYARSKARATLLLLDEVHKGGLDAVICCPTGVIGPWDYGICADTQPFYCGHTIWMTVG